MILAWLLLIAGLTISAVAIYYSVLGLASIFAAAVVPIVIMGTTLELSKLVAASWLKANWHRAPLLIKSYMTIAVVILMFITSMGIFGFLSKAHSDQNLVSGDVLAKLEIIDEKIRTEKENIDAARKALSQMDSQVNERLSRSTDDRGAERAVQIRRQQQAERAKLQKDIVTAQSNITKLNEEAAPIRAEVRKVEAEVGPIKYIAKLIYGTDTDTNMLEKAVTWVIILLVIVFDPLAVVMLLAAQMSFQWLKEEKSQDAYLQEAADALNDVFADELANTDKTPEELMGLKPDAWVADVGEKPTAEELRPEEPKPHHPDTHPYLRQGFKYPKDYEPVGPMVAKPEEEISKITINESSPVTVDSTEVKIEPELEDSKKKTYMIKEMGQQIVKKQE